VGAGEPPPSRAAGLTRTPFQKDPLASTTRLGCPLPCPVASPSLGHGGFSQAGVWEPLAQSGVTVARGAAGSAAGLQPARVGFASLSSESSAQEAPCQGGGEPAGLLGQSVTITLFSSQKPQREGKVSNPPGTPCRLGGSRWAPLQLVGPRGGSTAQWERCAPRPFPTRCNYINVEPLPPPTPFCCFGEQGGARPPTSRSRGGLRGGTAAGLSRGRAAARGAGRAARCPALCGTWERLRAQPFSPRDAAGWGAALTAQPARP